MIQKLRCLLYSIYDWSKSTWVVSHLFYAGKKYEHFEEIGVKGVVSRRDDGPQEDGDFTFDIESLSRGPLHCEMTPCYPIPKETLARLKVGAMVIVVGTRTYDPPHLGNDAKHEIHPVKHLEVL